MAKIASVTLTVGKDVSFSRLILAWLDGGFDFTNRTPPFMREVYDPATLPADREYEGAASDAREISDFLKEIDSLCASEQIVVINLTDGRVDGSVTWKQENTCEFAFYGSAMCLPDEAGKPKRRTDWNRAVSAITMPLHDRDIFISWMTLYEDFV